MGGGVWTPATPTTGGGALPHTWFYTGQAQQWEENTKVTLATDDGDPVGAMTNQGSDGYDILQGTSLLRPTLKLNILNSNPVWRFDGGDWLRGAFAGGALSQPITAFVVSMLTAVAAGDLIGRVMFDGDDATNRIQLYKTSTGNLWSMYAGTVVSNGAANDSWNIWTFLANTASSIAYKNGISQIVGNIGTKTIDGLTFGDDNTGGASGWKGDIAELLIYSVNLSTADKNQVGQYLATKYNISYTAIP